MGEGRALLVPEVPPAGEHHGHGVMVGGVDGLLVPYGAAGLDYGRDPTFRRRLHVIGKGEKGVGGHDAALGPILSTAQGQMNAGYPVGLPRSHAN